jgi:hypothetical protein
MIFYYLFFFFISSPTIFFVNSWKPIHQKGFFGMIGIQGITDKKQSIYEIFTKDGILQGVFLDIDEKGEQLIHPISIPINTQKRIWNIDFPSNILTTLFFNFIRYITCNKINLLGRANTSLMSMENNKIYALYERDLPYEIDIDFIEKKVSIGKRKWIDGIQYFSAHSKKRIINNKKGVDSIEYNVLNKEVIHHIISEEGLKLLEKKTVKSQYMPFIHDFYLLQENLVWIDSPFTFSVKKGFELPIGLDSEKPTFIHVGNDLYTLHKSIAIFHIAYVEETEKVIDIYTSIYKDLHFSEDIKKITGLYCCIRLYKGSQYAELIISKDLEKYNLDFPILCDNYNIFENNLAKSEVVRINDVDHDYIILRNIDKETKQMNGFLVVKKLQIIKKYFLEKDQSLLGEPVILYDEKIPYLFFFIKDTTKNYIMKINLLNDEIDKQEINTSFNMGFHSVWINNI